MDPLLIKIEKLLNEIKGNRSTDYEHQKLYIEIYEAIKKGITTFELPPNIILPPTRQLAQSLVVSRSTIIKSYELLRVEGYIESKTGSAHIILNQKKRILEKSIIKENIHPPKLSDIGNAFLSNESLINSTDDKSMAFRPGLPPLDIFSINQWKNLSNLYWKNINLSSLSYSPTSGNALLKQSIANHLCLTRGMICQPEQIFIVSGSLQSLFIIGSVLLNPNDKVYMENPSFPNVQSIFKGLRAQIIACPVDTEGIILPNNKNEQSIKLIHVTPLSHYPTGLVTSNARKTAIIELMNEQEGYIIENDYEHEISSENLNQKNIYSIDPNQRTIYLSTFNRILHPSLRIGIMVVPPSLIKPIDLFLKHSHRFITPSIQMVLHQFIEKKHFYKHIKKLKDVVAYRKKEFIKEFEKTFQEELQIKNKNSQQLQLLVHLPEQINDNHFVQSLHDHFIVAHSYSKCFIGEEKRSGLILGYPSVPVPVMKRKLYALHQVFKNYK